MNIWKKLFGRSEDRGRVSPMRKNWVVRYQKGGQTLYLAEPCGVSDPQKAEAGDEKFQKGLAAFMQAGPMSQQPALTMADLAQSLEALNRNGTLTRFLIFRGYDVRNESESAPTAEAVLLDDAIRDYEAQKSLTPAPLPPRTAPNLIDEAKDIVRNSKGANDLLARATQAGWSKVKEDFIGIYLQKGDGTLIFGVLPSQGPDTVWNAMMTTKESETVHLVTEGKIVV